MYIFVHIVQAHRSPHTPTTATATATATATVMANQSLTIDFDEFGPDGLARARSSARRTVFGDTVRSVDHESADIIHGHRQGLVRPRASDHPFPDIPVSLKARTREEFFALYPHANRATLELGPDSDYTPVGSSRDSAGQDFYRRLFEYRKAIIQSGWGTWESHNDPRKFRETYPFYCAYARMMFSDPLMNIPEPLFVNIFTRGHPVDDTAFEFNLGGVTYVRVTHTQPGLPPQWILDSGKEMADLFQQSEREYQYYLRAAFPQFYGKHHTNGVDFLKIYPEFSKEQGWLVDANGMEIAFVENAIVADEPFLSLSTTTSKRARRARFNLLFGKYKELLQTINTPSTTRSNREF